MEIRKLPAADRPREFYLYEVQGSGVLPLDMLRYDSAWPADQQSVSRMSGGFLMDRQAQPRRTIRLGSYRRPTVDRWNSFGWTVLD